MIKSLLPTKILFGFILTVLALVSLSFLTNTIGIKPEKTKAADNANATLSVDVTEYIALTIGSGGTVDFSTLTPGNLVKGPSGGTVVSVTTSAANGYTLGVSDGVASTNSALVHTDATTYIADYAGTIGTPTSWSGNGLGITLFAADNNKDVKWGTGTTYDDTNNKYAGVPENNTTAHTVTGYHETADTSSWAFGLQVPNSQKTGTYSGDVTFTATAVLL